MKEEDKIYVLCVTEEEEHLSDCKVVKCSFCSGRLWISPHHLGVSNRFPVCLECATERLIKDRDTRIGILKKDHDRAMEAIRKMQPEEKRKNGIF